MALSARNGSKPSAPLLGRSPWPFGDRSAQDGEPTGGYLRYRRGVVHVRGCGRWSDRHLPCGARSFTLARAGETFGLAGVGGTGGVDRDPNEHAPLLLHGAPVVVPVGVLPTDAGGGSG